MCIGKESWPELVGMNGKQVETIIEKENPRVDAIIVEEGSSVIGDFLCNRVWVWVNKNGVVVQVPRIGWNMVDHLAPAADALMYLKYVVIAKFILFFIVKLGSNKVLDMM